MNILLLGNGFDLHYHLPTKYHNFLHTANYLINNYSENIKSVGDIFSNSELQKVDKHIANSYSKHAELYNSTALDVDKTAKLIDYVNNNIWFKYLLKSFNKDVGWIDFETEIAVVIKNFKDFFEDLKIDFSEEKISKDEFRGHIIKNFDFFYKQTKEHCVKYGMISYAQYSVKEDYVIEYPLGSGIKIINTEKIIKHLSDSLSEFANALKLYLNIFVENVFDTTSAQKHLPQHKALLHSDFVVTLNYTNIFEKLYSYNKIFHLHGDVNGDIILGVNSDFYDELDNLDTSFVAFKKYYQRVSLETDYEYLRWCNETVNDIEENIHVLVMGHSIDITDKDIIVDLFDVANKITILYHNQDAKSSYISNLIKIFGKSHFYNLRKEKHLSFLPINSDFTQFAQERAENSYISYTNFVDPIIFDRGEISCI